MKLGRYFWLECAFKWDLLLLLLFLFYFLHQFLLLNFQIQEEIMPSFIPSCSGLLAEPHFLHSSFPSLFQKEVGMKGVYLWNPLWFIIYFLKTCEMLDQIHRCTPAGKLRSRRRKRRLASGELQDFTASRGQGLLFHPIKMQEMTKTLSWIQWNIKTSLILYVNTSKVAWMEVIQAGGALQGTCRRCSTPRPQADPKFQLLQCPWTLWPTGNIPLLLSPPPAPQRCCPCSITGFWGWGIDSTGSLSLSCTPEPKNVPGMWRPWKPWSCRVLQPTFLTKWWQSASHISFKSSNYGISCTSAGNKTPDCGSFWEMSTQSRHHLVFLAS